jgi:high-affinity iron transporter
VFAYLRRLGRLDLSRAVWMGVGVAALASIAVGVVVHLTVGSLEGAARFRAFAAISVIAVVVLTWMIFWMRRQSRAIKGTLEHRVDDALHATHVRRALMAVAMLAVLREGIEAALFMIAAATQSDGWDVLVGAIIGLGIATVLGLLVYVGGRTMPMAAFFKITGVVLIVFAAGLLARTVLFLQSSGDLGTVDSAVYDVTSVRWLTQQTEVGRFLGALFGWDPRPSFEQAVAWLAYFVPVTYLFLRRPRSATASEADLQPALEPEPVREPVASAR